MEVNLKGSDLHPDLGSFIELIREDNPEQAGIRVKVESVDSMASAWQIIIYATHINLNFLLEEKLWLSSIQVLKSEVKASGHKTVLTLQIQLL